ncbi:tyrosine-type recombinase/integrase [Salmonella enterica subsp. enterica]|nr:tyrosine-type recombinase/integrase [Salmonella enterica subsp. enterica serovar Miami]
MAIVTRPLTAAEIQKAKPATKPYMLFDGRGLCLQVKPNGKKYWRYRYTRPSTGKSTDISLGLYPDVSLADARLEHQKNIALLAKGIDPKALEREAQQQVKIAEETRFSVVAKRWLEERKKGKVTEQHYAQIWSSLENNVLPAIGDISVTELRAPDLIDALRPIEARGALETLRRIVQRVNEIMEHAINLGLLDINPLYRVNRVFDKPEVTNMPTIPPERLPELVQRIEMTNLSLMTRYLIKWQLLTLVRPGEAAGTRWSEIDMENRLWTIPAERMKKRREHKVPLSPQAIAVVEQLRSLGSHSPFVFPGRVKRSQPMSSETVNKALWRMGYGGELVSHGFRALGCTAMIDAGFPVDVVDAVLAHAKDKNDEHKAIEPYDRSTRLLQRVELMEWWGKQVSEASVAARVI